MQDKKEFREKAKLVLTGLNPVAKGFASMQKCMAIIQSDRFDKAEVVLGFMSLADEVDVLPVMRRGLELGKKVLVPKVRNDGGMDFFFLENDPIADTEAGAWGIFEPKESLEKADFSRLTSDLSAERILVLVPGLAFGRDGSRLGRGKGFYDRFLNGLSELLGANPVTIGVCFDQLVFDTVPHDENDFSVDFLV